MQIIPKWTNIIDYSVNEKSEYDMHRIRMDSATFDLVNKKHLASFDCQNWVDLMGEILMVHPVLIRQLKFLIMEKYDDAFWTNDVIFENIANNNVFCDYLKLLGQIEE